MSAFTILAIYLVVWWLVLLITLPFGVRGQAEEDSVVEGTEPGAPVLPMMWKKVGVTSVVSAILTALFVVSADQGWVDWEDLFRLNMFADELSDS